MHVQCTNTLVLPSSIESDVFSCSAHHERYSLATVQGETANSVQATAQHSSSRQSSKDCVIQ